MNILQILKQLRDDLKAWATNNFNALNAKIEENTIPIDNELNLNSTNPVQNKTIATEIADINERVGNTAVSEQINTAIANQPHFSGDYTDLTNAPNITEDESGNVIISDEAGNIIFEAGAEGIHTTALFLEGDAAATESYVDNAIANIEFPEADLTSYATKEFVTTAINAIEIPEVDFTGYATETYVDVKVADLVNSAPEALNTLGELASALETHEDAYDALLETVGNKVTKTDFENFKTEINEVIESETAEFYITDETGNIVASIDEKGLITTAVEAQDVTVAGNSVKDHLDDESAHVTASEKEAWNNKSDFSGSYNDLVDKPDLSDYATEDFVTTKIAEVKLENAGLDLSGYATKEDIKNFITEETDSTVPAWAKEATKPTYTAAEVGALANTTVLADLTEDASHRTVTDTEKQTWNAKSDFSGDYNDLTNAPDISEDESGDLIIADTNGNILFRSNSTGLETVNLTVETLTINGKSIQDMIRESVEEIMLGGKW